MKTIINDEIEFDNETVLKKWSPVLDALKVSDEKLRLFLSVYSEYFLSKHKHNGPVTALHNSTWAPYPSEPLISVVLNESFNLKSELLPINLKILSRLNLKDKHYEIKINIPEKHIGIPISYEKYSDIKRAGQMDALMCLENIIVDKFVEKINLELETNNEIYISALIDSIMIKDISTSVWDIKYEVILTTKYEVK